VSIDPIESRFMKGSQVLLRRYCSLACSASDARSFIDPDADTSVDQSTTLLHLFQRAYNYPVQSLTDSLFGDWAVYQDLIRKTGYDWLEQPINPLAGSLQPTMYVTMFELYIIYALLFAPFTPSILTGQFGDADKREKLIADIKAFATLKGIKPEQSVIDTLEQLVKEHPELYYKAIMSLGIPTHVDNAFYQSSQAKQRVKYLTNHIALLKPDLSSISIKVGKSMNNPNLSSEQAKTILSVSNKIKSLAETKTFALPGPEKDVEIAPSQVERPIPMEPSRNVVAPYCDVTLVELKDWLMKKLVGREGKYVWLEKSNFKFGETILWPFYKAFPQCAQNMIDQKDEKWIKMVPKVKQYILDWMQSKSAMQLQYETMEAKAFLEGGDIEILRMRRFSPPEQQYDITVNELFKQYKQRYLAQARSEDPNKAAEIYEAKAEEYMKVHNPNSDAIALAKYINSLYESPVIEGVDDDDLGTNFQLMIWNALPTPEREGTKVMGKEKGPVYGVNIVLDFPYEFLNIPTTAGDVAPFRFGGKLGHGKVEEVNKTKMARFLAFTSKIAKSIVDPEIEQRYYQTLQIVDTILQLVEQILQESNTSLDLALIQQVEDTVGRGRGRLSVESDGTVDAELQMRRALDEAITKRNAFRKDIEREYNALFDTKGKVAAFTQKGAEPLSLTAYDSQFLFYYPKKASYEQEGLYSVSTSAPVELPPGHSEAELSFDDVAAAMQEIEQERGSVAPEDGLQEGMEEGMEDEGFASDVEHFDEGEERDDDLGDDEDYGI